MSTSQSEPSVSALSLLTSTPQSLAPPELTHLASRWVLIDHAANRRKGTKQSRVWEFGQEYIYRQNSLRNMPGAVASVSGTH
jgi:hypothetical protein